MPLNIDIYINEELVNLILENDMKIGEGQYGNVYYFTHNKHKYIIKLSHNTELKKTGPFTYEQYIYKKYYQENINREYYSLPKCYDVGKTIDSYSSTQYNYIVFDYVGNCTLERFFRLILKSGCIITDEVKNLISILYAVGIAKIQSLHNINIACRDVKGENIIISDDVLVYILNKISIDNPKFNFKDTFLFVDMEIKKNYEDIVNSFLVNDYDKLLYIIDTGLFCDMTIFNNNIYDPYDDKSYGIFPEVFPFDTLFISTTAHMSPFAIFNLSSIINIQNDDNRKNLIDLCKILLKMSDFWALNVSFVIFLVNFTFIRKTNKVHEYYFSELKKRNTNLNEFIPNNCGIKKNINAIMFDIIIDYQQCLQIGIKQIIIANIHNDNYWFYNTLISCTKTILHSVKKLSSNIQNRRVPFELGGEFFEYSDLHLTAYNNHLKRITQCHIEYVNNIVKEIRSSGFEKFVRTQNAPFENH
jgi:serine/threonine protein kinase